MKEIMLPYILLIWILVKTGVMEWNLKNQFWSVSIGFLIFFLLLSASRFWSPADMTNSSTVRAPSAILSPLLNEKIDKIFVVHNEKVKKGEILYTLHTDSTQGEIAGKEGGIEAFKAKIIAQESLLSKQRKNLERYKELGEKDYSSEQQIDNINAAVKQSMALIKSYDSEIARIEGEKDSLEYADELKTIRAPFDGQMTVVNTAEGTRTGNMSIYNTAKKFVEMRIPEQAYTHIHPGQFAEFYVNTHPGKIFRARVHSKRVGTGEASMSSVQGDRSVGQFVQQNAPSHGRTVILSFVEPEGVDLPIGATGSAWISAEKPYSWLGFMDVIGAAIVRISAVKAYLNAF